MYDIRDNKSYTVRKLADGNCWMVENLRLGGSTAITLHSSDSDVSSDWVLPAAQTSGSDEWSDASNSTNTKHVYAQSDTTYGNLYNWYTATAGTGTGDMETTDTANPVNATDSICPKGWRLPDGGQSTNKSFYALDVALGGNGSPRADATQRDRFNNVPYSFPYSGYYNYYGGVTDQGSNGLWWSRSAFTAVGQTYYFTLGANSYMDPQHPNSVGYGFSVRCVAE